MEGVFDLPGGKFEGDLKEGLIPLYPSPAIPLLNIHSVCPEITFKISSSNSFLKKCKMRNGYCTLTNVSVEHVLEKRVLACL